MTNKKIFIIVISVVAVLAVLLTVILTALFAPRRGKTYYSFWSPTQAIGDIYDSELVNLKKTADKDFKILQLTDIQIYALNKTAKNTFAVIKKLVDENQPDLIVLTGDNVEGSLAYMVNAGLTKFIDSLGVPWAPVFGNHDAEHSTVDKQYLGEQFRNSKNCLFRFGPSNIKGVGNYVVNIQEDDKIVYSLHMVDSNMYERNIDNSSPYDYIGYDQIAYFKWYSERLNGMYSDEIPSMSFFHIAPVELLNEYKRLKDLNPTSDVVKVPEGLGFGEFREAPCPSALNSGYVDMAKSIGMTHMFIGHDHINNASIKLNDIIMTYGLKTGYGSYFDKDLSGGTLISIDSNRNVKIQHKYAV